MCDVDVSKIHFPKKRSTGDDLVGGAKDKLKQMNRVDSVAAF